MNKENLIKLLLSSNETDIEQILRSVIYQISGAKETLQKFDARKHILNLKNLVDKYNSHEQLNVGDIVQWKEGLKNKRRPENGEPCIVIEILTTPIFDNEAPLASPYFLEKLDIKLGLIGENSEFFTFHYDQNRFELQDDYRQESLVTVV